MSIINDALKKTQLNLKRPDKKQAPQDKQENQIKQEQQDGKSISNLYENLYQVRQDPPDAPATPPAPEARRPKKSVTPRRAKRWSKILFTCIFSLSSISGGFFLATRWEPLQDFFRSLTTSRIPSQAYISQPGQERQKYRTGDLILNGTSLIEGKKVALINDEIYEIGEIVNGKKIISIGLTKVELLDDQKTITLNVH